MSILKTEVQGNDYVLLVIDDLGCSSNVCHTSSFKISNVEIILFSFYLNHFFFCIN